MTRVAFQGVAGAYSEQAVRQFFSSEVNGVACQTLADVFFAVERHDAEYGMLPIENAVAGSVTRSYQLLMEHDLRVHAELILRVRHMLLAPPGAKLDDLERVRSHPQALAQCQRYLERHGLEPEPAFDTAGSARDLAADPEAGVAVIAGDVVSLYANIEQDIPVAVADDLEECRRAMEKVRRAGDLALPSHDPEVMRRYPGGVIG